MQVHHAGWGGMLALSSLAAGSDEERSKVQSLTLTGCPPSYKQLVADHQQKVSSTCLPASYAALDPCYILDPCILTTANFHMAHTIDPDQKMCSSSSRRVCKSRPCRPQ